MSHRTRDSERERKRERIERMGRQRARQIKGERWNTHGPSGTVLYFKLNRERRPGLGLINQLISLELQSTLCVG
jgi:hypothetical protein